MNAAQIRAFARGEAAGATGSSRWPNGQLAKTDRLDAELIAHFAEALRPGPRPLASEAARGFAELVARRRQLVEVIGMETNRGRSARSPKVLEGIASTLKALEAALAAIDREIEADWRRRESAAAAAAFLPLSVAPGEAYQFDWIHEVMLINGTTVTVKVAHVLHRAGHGG